MAHFYSKNFFDAVHIIQATDDLPYNSVESRAQSSTSHNTCMDIVRIKINLYIYLKKNNNNNHQH